MSFTFVTKRVRIKAFVERECRICYNERGIMEGICHNEISHQLQGDNGRCLLSEKFASVTRRGDWKVFVVREII